MILVIGAGGTVGTALAAELQQAGHRPRLAFRSTEKAARAAAAGHDAVALDYTRPQTFGRAFDGVDAVFLLGTGVVEQAAGEANVVVAARAAGVGRIVKLSVWGAEREDYALGRLHRTVERAVEVSGLAWTFLRPNNYMQNFLADAATIQAEGVFYLPAGEARVNHVDARDVARVAARVLTTPGHEGKAYSLSGPRAISYDEAACILSGVLGREVRYVPVPDDVARCAMIADGAPELYADTVVDLNRYFRDGGAAGTSGDVAQVTGRDPVTFEQFVRDHAAALAAPVALAA